MHKCHLVYPDLGASDGKLCAHFCMIKHNSVF